MEVTNKMHDSSLNVVDPTSGYLGVIDVFFDLTQGEPKLPIKLHGKIWHRGWDIPTEWAIDAAAQTWVEGILGRLEKTSPEKLIQMVETDEQKREIAGCLSLPTPMPQWAQKALDAGWKPPEGWKP